MCSADKVEYSKMALHGMKCAILAGGRGSRMGGLTDDFPKPLVTVGGQPVLWHVMNLFARFGLRDFVVALGYEGRQIHDYLMQGPLATNGWMVKPVDTGADTQTAGRIRRLQPWLEDGTFFLTWADGVSDIDLEGLLRFHKAHGRLATVTAVNPPPRFGLFELDGDRVTRFQEKPRQSDEWINGAFFVLEPGIFDYIESDTMQWEQEPMSKLAADGELMAYRHRGFWQCMDTPGERDLLETLWMEGNAPWTGRD
jgi:glucose-1-phosphate cytidylyltransferase